MDFFDKVFPLPMTHTTDYISIQLFVYPIIISDEQQVSVNILHNSTNCVEVIYIYLFICFPLNTQL